MLRKICTAAALTAAILVCTVSAVGTLSLTFKAIFIPAPKPAGLLCFAAATAVIGVFYLTAYRCRHFFPCAAVILTIAASVRVPAVLLWRIPPTSDFLTTFEISKSCAAVPLDRIHTLTDSFGIYTSQWSVHMPFVLYQAVIMKIFGMSALPIQLANCAASVVTVYLCMLISKKLWGVGSGLFSGFLAAVYPTFIFFMPVLSNQHIATMFFILALYMFICRPLKNIYLNFTVCALALALSQLMRPEMYVVIIAAVCIFVFYTFISEKLSANTVLRNGSVLILFTAVFFALLFAVNLLLSKSGIINGSIFENNIAYKLLVGLNSSSNGMWNSADALLIYDSHAINDELMRRVCDISRLPPLMLKKVLRQFGNYTYAWSFLADTAFHTAVSGRIIAPLSQSVSAVTVTLMVIGTFFGGKRCTDLFALYIIIAGFVCAFALIEVQDRYNYFIIPLFTVLAGGILTVGKRSR